MKTAVNQEYQYLQITFQEKDIVSVKLISVKLHQICNKLRHLGNTVCYILDHLDDQNRWNFAFHFAEQPDQSCK